MSLALVDLSFGHRGRIVGSGVSISIADGEVLALLGPNGSGKTTLFKTILGILPATGGEVLIDGRRLSSLSRSARAQAIAYVPQAHAALFPFAVVDVVLMGRAAHLSAYASPGRDDFKIAQAALERLSIAALAERPYTELSGGERQLVLVARALAQGARILVLDEPTASLDYGNQMRVLSQIRGLAAEGMSVVLSTHNPDHVFMVADRVALLHGGALIATGPPRDVLTAARLKQLYDVDVVIGQLQGSDAPVCSPRFHPGEIDGS